MQPLAHSHSGSQQTVAGFRLDTRARVALINRSITLKAADAAGAQPYIATHTDSTAQQQAQLHLDGVHIAGHVPVSGLPFSLQDVWSRI